mgnify:CR=1 FL=1
MENINKRLLNGIGIDTTASQSKNIKNDEITINLTNITEDAREKIIEEIIRNLNSSK